MARWLVGNESNSLDCMLIDPLDTTLTQDGSLYYHVKAYLEPNVGLLEASGPQMRALYVSVVLYLK